MHIHKSSRATADLLHNAPQLPHSWQKIEEEVRTILPYIRRYDFERNAFTAFPSKRMAGAYRASCGCRRRPRWLLAVSARGVRRTLKRCR